MVRKEGFWTPLGFWNTPSMPSMLWDILLLNSLYGNFIFYAFTFTARFAISSRTSWHNFHFFKLHFVQISKPCCMLFKGDTEKAAAVCKSRMWYRDSLWSRRKCLYKLFLSLPLDPEFRLNEEVRLHSAWLVKQKVLKACSFICRFHFFRYEELKDFDCAESVKWGRMFLMRDFGSSPVSVAHAGQT